MSMHDNIEKILLTEDEIREKVRELSAKLTADYKDKNPLFICILRGSFIFMADLVRGVDTKCTMDFMSVSSYGKKSQSTGAVMITKDLEMDIEDRHVVIVEDILDSGLTLSFIIKLLGTKKPASVKICTLLDKPARRNAAVTADYVGFVVPDSFLVGYGLDYADEFRNLPYIGILSPEVYENE